MGSPERLMKKGETEMTFEKWLQEMKKQMAMEMVFPSIGGSVTAAPAEEMNVYIEEDDTEE
jgi:hypothetical protein